MVESWWLSETGGLCRLWSMVPMERLVVDHHYPSSVVAELSLLPALSIGAQSSCKRAYLALNITVALDFWRHTFSIHFHNV